LKLPQLKIKKTFLLNIGLSLATAFLVFFFSSSTSLNQLKSAVLDFSFQFKKPLADKPNIIIIEVSDADIDGVGRWPWSRTWHAAMLKALKELGVKSTYFDIIFSGAATEEEDKIFEETVKASNNAYLPFAFQDTNYNMREAIMPLEMFSSAAKGIGSINVYPDSDGIFRKIPLILKAGDGKYYPHMALKIALDYNGLQIKEIKPRHLIASGNNEILDIPLIEKNNFLITWPAKNQDVFKHYSYIDVLAKYKDYLDKKISAKEMKIFKDSICLVTVTAIGLGDIKPVPMHPEYPGAKILAVAINNLLNKTFIHTPPLWLNILLLFLFAIFPAFIMFGEKPLKENLIIVLTGVVFASIYLVLFRYGFYMEPSMPLLGLLSSTLTIGTYNFIRISREKQNFFKMAVTDGLTGLYNIRYFRMLIETEIMLSQPDISKKFAIVMSDVDHFKHFNDTYGHQVGDAVLKAIADSLKSTVRSSDVVARYGGEEMIILLRGATDKDAMRVAEKLRKNIEEMTIKEEKAVHKVTASFGVSIYRQGDTTNSLIKRADDALYKSKKAGRNRISSEENLA